MLFSCLDFTLAFSTVRRNWRCLQAFHLSCVCHWLNIKSLFTSLDQVSALKKSYNKTLSVRFVGGLCLLWANDRRDVWTTGKAFGADWLSEGVFSGLHRQTPTLPFHFCSRGVVSRRRCPWVHLNPVIHCCSFLIFSLTVTVGHQTHIFFLLYLRGGRAVTRTGEQGSLWSR